MKTRIGAAASALALVVALGAGLAHAAPPDHGQGAPAVSKEPGPNLMHPVFAPIDADGVPIMRSGRPASSVRTCGACHDAEKINAANDHWNDRVHVECAACHFAGGHFPTDRADYDAVGRLVREAVRISPPRNENCAACHVLVHLGKEPLELPADFGTGGAGIEPLAMGGSATGDPAGAPRPSSRTDAFTMLTGSIVSDQDVSASLLNLSGKETRQYPWDAHARRLVDCVSCHYAANNPIRTDAKTKRPGYLAQDPRRLTVSEYLRSPDHRLHATDCSNCHAPLQVHQFLPYKARHLAVLECTACHVPRLFGPAARMIDSTVVTVTGGPAILWRGIDPRPGESLNTAYVTGYQPMLARPAGSGRGRKLAPVNPVETWSWHSGPDGGRVPWRTVRAAYFEGAAYAPAVLAAFDADHDGSLSPEELRLDAPAKTELIRRRLVAAGVQEPRIARAVALHPVNHGVLSREQVSRDCLACHAKHGSRITAGLELSSYIPGGSGGPRGATAIDAPPVAGYAVHVRGSSLGTRIEPDAPRGAETLGHARGGWSDRVGFLIFLAVVLGVAVHGGIRFATRAGRGGDRGSDRGVDRASRQRVYMYTRYERIWHWLMAASVLVLVLTGLQVHFAGVPDALPLPTAVRLHNIFAVLLAVNAFLSLFYHIVSSTIARFFPDPDGLPARILEQVKFYMSGIFLGRPHPTPKTPERRLNPLQQVTYLLLLNVLFPLQIGTGILIWAVSANTSFADRVGGLTALAPLHNFGAWLLLAFIVLHVYLTTTGHTVFSNLRAMASGYDEVEAAPVSARGGSHG